MDPLYRIDNTSDIVTPALVVFRDIVEQNIEQMLCIARSAPRLRPHCKTHKMPEVVALQLRRGIVKHKCATIAEAEMLAEAGAKDVFLAYNIVGANIVRMARLLQKYPEVAFSVTADHPDPVSQLGQVMQKSGQQLSVLLDLDTGQHRTGVPVGPPARSLYGQIACTPGLQAGGLHVYDGQNHQQAVEERRQAVQACWESVARFRDELTAAQYEVPRIVAGGTASFPIFAEMDDPLIELSPGTCTLYDAGYGRRFPDLPFAPAAMLLTRVISRPTRDRVTLDLGYKACASDPPAGQRLVFPDLPEVDQVLQNEEHLVLETAKAGSFVPGDELLAIPWHICPTSALHREAVVVSGGQVIGRWAVAARDRWLTV